MFTGIVEEIGTVRQIKKGKHSAVLTISAGDVLDGTKTGDSIAVNGICLTVTAVLPGAFMADVMHETLNRSALIGLSAGSPVNLERAMQANGRFGGHIVAGHVDGTGKIVKIERDDTAVWFTIQTKPELMRYIVEKGSVAIDGISLTVAKITESDFSVSAIPHTVKQTVLQEKRKGDLVNLETDIIGKYVEKLLSPALEEQKESKITKEFLANCGF
ncbi:MAG: riboflavin synthase [Lachnospiraceae bacterium]|nr:riboflavin synthase [Lachnospiraceae bacterium]